MILTHLAFLDQCVTTFVGLSRAYRNVENCRPVKYSKMKIGSDKQTGRA